MRVCVFVCLAYRCIVCICLRAGKYIWKYFHALQFPVGPAAHMCRKGTSWGEGGSAAPFCVFPLKFIEINDSRKQIQFTVQMMR